jgi:hypothetical protein
MGVPYPCQKTTTDWKFCYQVTKYRREIVGLQTKVTMCEGNDQYVWWEPGMNELSNLALVASEQNPIETCFGSAKQRAGSCQ